MSHQPAVCISYPKPNPQASLRLFCFPYAGGGASLFRAWPDDLPPAVEIGAVQYPGRENRWREPLLSDGELLVESLAADLQPHLDRPFAFFGHSLGALIAFEIARRIDHAARSKLVQLFVSAHAAPHITSTNPPLHQLPPAEFRRKIAELDGTPQEVLQNAELMELVLPILRADFTINETYVYRPDLPLDRPISALGGLRDQLVTRPQLEAWRAQTTGAFTLRMFPGQHFFINDMGPLVRRIIAQDLLPALSRVSGQVGP
jgi:medium-chain acyl-[acyl-carrier-protein] hydrolase